MPNIHTNRARTALAKTDIAKLDCASLAPSINWRSMPLVSDDECLTRLAKAVENHDPESLDEVAWLIGRLAVPIE